MPDALILFDILLACAVVVLAAATISLREGFSMIVAFVVFGLLSALAWVRLSAPDVALAEAAIGTGVTGALLLKTLHHIGEDGPVTAPAPRGALLANAAFCVAILAGLSAAFIQTPLAQPGLAPGVGQNVSLSGVEHPVTAVLLNFRAYDTLMEVVVLLAAVIAVWMVERGAAQAPAPALGEIYRGFSRLALPAIAVIGAYLLWAGAHAPGGAFQGGAVLAAVGLLLLLSRLHRPAPQHRAMARGLFVLGTAVFAAVAILVAGGGRATFEYPTAQAKSLILVIEAMVTISIAVTLAALFHGREPALASSREDRT